VARDKPVAVASSETSAVDRVDHNACSMISCLRHIGMELRRPGEIDEWNEWDGVD
jgi:hypothetical protein